MLCCCENSEHHGKAQSHIKPNIGKNPLEEFPQAIEDELDHNVLKLVIRPNGMED